MFIAVFVRNIQRAALPLKRKSPAILFKTTGNPLELFFRSSRTHLGFLGLLASAACFAMWNRACREIGVVHATIGLYFTPIVGVVFAAIFLGERLTTMSTLGGFVIIVGVAIANWRKK